jgi:ABC-type multidrug transport system fused ATPase/permease subunit
MISAEKDTLEHKRSLFPGMPGNVKNFWAKMDDVFFKTIEAAETSYKVNLYINIIIVIIGVVFIVNAIVFAWINKSDSDKLWSMFLGSVGIVSFVTLFFVKPQINITKAIGNLAQVQIAYKAHLLMFESLFVYINESRNAGTLRLLELKELNAELFDRTITAAEIIQKYTEDDFRIEEENGKGNTNNP